MKVLLAIFTLTVQCLIMRVESVAAKDVSRHHVFDSNENSASGDGLSGQGIGDLISDDQGEGNASAQETRASGSRDCLEALFMQAELTESEVPRYIQAFRKNSLDADAIFRLSFSELNDLLLSEQFSFKQAGDVFKLHKCTSSQGPCQEQPFCMNGGQCVHVDRLQQHVCECPDTFKGARCDEEIKDRIAKIESTVASLQRRSMDSSAVYTRWGQEKCNADVGTSLVYTGFMAGPWYTHKGGGAAYLCMPQEPIYDKTRAGFQCQAVVYVSEFKTSGYFSPFAGFNNHNPKCAICQAGGGRGSTITIPARNECPSGWALEYKGYLMTGHHGHRRTQYICVDENPVVVESTQANNNGALLYFIEAVCQAEMPCNDEGKYDQTKELTCAVCSR